MNLAGLDVCETEELLGIDPQVFTDAVQSAIAPFRSVNAFHPRTAAGSRAWEEIVASFRQMVVSEYPGWKSRYLNGMPVLINSGKQKTIVITSGDHNTGLDMETLPKTKNQKGEKTKQFVGENYDLFESSREICSNAEKLDKHETWVLLYTIDKVQMEIRFELSLPTQTELAGHRGKVKISGWEKRFLFPAVPFDADISNIEKPAFTDATDFFDVIKK